MMICEYTSAYREECIDIFMDNFTNEPFNYDWMQRDKITRYFIDTENTPNYFGFLLIENGAVIGICMGTTGDYFECVTYEIKEFFIRRDMQGNGCGSRMLAQIEGVLKGSGINAVTLNTNNDLRAADFYKKNGYELAPKAVLLGKLL